MRALSALLVAFIFVTAAAVPVTGITPAPDRSMPSETTPLRVDTVNDTTNQLTVPDEEVSASTYQDAGVDVGTAVQAGSTRLHQRQEALAFQERFRRTDSPTRHAALVNDELTEIQRRQSALDDRQDTAIQRFAAGEITARQFLSVRLMVHAEAAELLDTLDRISAAPDTVTGYSLSSTLSMRLRNAEGELRTLTGPVGQQLHATTTNSGTTSVTYLEASPDSYLLATVGENQYVREARLDGERDPDGADEFLQDAQDAEGLDRFNAADERAASLYEWLYERQRPSFTYYGTTGIYELTADHPDGQLTAYIDGSTTNVFYEAQHRNLADVQMTATETAVTDSLQMTVQRSSRSGPMLVTLTDADTGEPVDGTVTINGYRFGTTGNDGALWTVEPRGAYTVNATADGTGPTVSVPA